MTPSQARALEQSRDRLKQRVKNLEYELARVKQDRAALAEDYKELREASDMMRTRAHHLIKGQAQTISSKSKCMMAGNRMGQALHIWYQSIEDSRVIPAQELFEKLMHAYHEWRDE